MCSAVCQKYPRLVPVRGPVHASWLNQIEIYFSIAQRKALTPKDFDSLKALRQRLVGFQKHFAKPFMIRQKRSVVLGLLGIRVVLVYLGAALGVIRDVNNLTLALVFSIGSVAMIGVRAGRETGAEPLEAGRQPD